MMLFAPYVSAVPLVVLASVLTMTAIGMFEWEPLRLIPKTPLPDAIVLILTMVITVVADLITAVLAGFALAGFLFVYRMSELGVTNLLSSNRTGVLDPEDLERMRKHKIVAYDIEGPLFFGAARNFVREIERESSFRVIILNMTSVPVVDTTGALALEDIVDRLRRDKKKLIIAGLRKEVRTVLHRLGVSQKIGVGNFAGDLRRAVDYAVAHVTGQAERVHLGTYLSQDLILLDVEAESKEELFKLMAGRAAREKYVTDIVAFSRDLWEREESASTGLTNGVALPHSRSGSAGKVVVIAARLKSPLEYETLDGKPVRLVFMIAASSENDIYLRLLSMLAGAIGKTGVIDALLAADTTHDFYDILAHEIDHEDHP
jgi:mannitol/fructose-specific phosphotransferase system IIA component (Ntr-type)/anti-anti-sigma regulatory factor